MPGGQEIVGHVKDRTSDAARTDDSVPSSRSEGGLDEIEGSTVRGKQSDQ